MCSETKKDGRLSSHVHGQGTIRTRLTALRIPTTLHPVLKATTSDL
jgi:hypothetical protein